MESFKFKLFLLIFFAWNLKFLNCFIVTSTALYQVSIRYNELPDKITGNTNVAHICNGVIIHEKYILTSAFCVYEQNKAVNVSFYGSPLYIMAGNITLNTNEGIRRNVVSIITHPKFNPVTNENDVALLKLDRKLPTVNNSTTLQWIDLQQIESIIDGKCFINIYNNSVGPNDYPYSMVKNISAYHDWICKEWQMGNNVTINNQNELCLEYTLSADYMCNSTSATLKTNGDRGTALVCDSKLAAFLVEIMPARNLINCLSTRKTTAYYLKIAPYVNWIQTEIGFVKPQIGTTIPWTPFVSSTALTPTHKNSKSNSIKAFSAVNTTGLILFIIILSIF